jgi:hypothetical protein
METLTTTQILCFLREMVTSAPEELVKKLNKVRKCWNLCKLPFKNIKNAFFNVKTFSFSILN